MTAERDKFNVWVALMNLEDAYGGDGAEDALMAVFNRCAAVITAQRSGRCRDLGQVGSRAAQVPTHFQNIDILCCLCC
jgi:hypothetical protein